MSTAGSQSRPPSVADIRSPFAWALTGTAAAALCAAIGRGWLRVGLAEDVDEETLQAAINAWTEDRDHRRQPHVEVVERGRFVFARWSLERRSRLSGAGRAEMRVICGGAAGCRAWRVYDANGWLNVADISNDAVEDLGRSLLDVLLEHSVEPPP